MERSQLAEVQLPPVRVGRRQDGRERPENRQGHEHPDRVDRLVARRREHGDQRHDRDAHPGGDRRLQRRDVSAPREVVQQDEYEGDEQSRDERLCQARRDRVDPMAPVAVVVAACDRHLGAPRVCAIRQNPARRGGRECGEHPHRPVAPEGYGGVARGRSEREHRGAHRENRCAEGAPRAQVGRGDVDGGCDETGGCHVQTFRGVSGCVAIARIIAGHSFRKRPFSPLGRVYESYLMYGSVQPPSPVTTIRRGRAI